MSGVARLETDGEASHDVMRCLPSCFYVALHLFDRPHLRPNANRHFTELEDNLLTHGLDAFRFVKEQKVVYELIQEYQLPTKTPKQVS